MLDLGCGFGGRPARFVELGAKSVTGIEVSDRLVRSATDFARSRGLSNTRFLQGTGEQIPLEDERFDLITMVDVMEHVVAPQDVLRECYRVLRPGGKLAIVFPPYYALKSGSHLHGYATSFPGLNLLFSTQTLKRAARSQLSAQGIDFQQYFREIPTDKLWNMNGLTVQQFHTLVRDSGFAWEHVHYVAEYTRSACVRQGLARWMRLPFFWAFEVAAHVPFLREICCGRVCALLKK